MEPLRAVPGGSALLLLLLLLLSPAAAQPPPTSSDSPYGYGSNISPPVGVIIIVLVAALFLLGFFSMYVRHCSGADRSVSDPMHRLSAAQAAGRGPRGLDSAVIDSFPVFDYAAVKSLKIGKGALECAVCLNEFEDDETLRLIPKCDHVFHSECVDTWLAAHTTCPVCRADLTPVSGESVHAPQLTQISEARRDHDDDAVIVDVLGRPDGPSPAQCTETESMEQPLNAALPPPVPRLNRNRTRRSASGRRWLGRFSRSNSTGHVAVKQWENMERFTLRLPEEVRRQLISGKLRRSTSLVALPREGSSRRGYRGPVGEGSSRGRSMFGSLRFDRSTRSDRWMFSLTRPFFSRAPSVRSPKVASAGGGSVRSSRLSDSVHASTAPEANLPPV